MPSLLVRNIKCDACARTIRRRVGAIDGVSQVKVDIASGAVLFEGDEGLLPQVQATLAKLGYVVQDGDDSNSIMAAARSVMSCLVGRVRSEDD